MKIYNIIIENYQIFFLYKLKMYYHLIKMLHNIHVSMAFHQKIYIYQIFHLEFY